MFPVSCHSPERVKVISLTTTATSGLTPSLFEELQGNGGTQRTEVPRSSLQRRISMIWWQGCRFQSSGQRVSAAGVIRIEAQGFPKLTNGFVRLAFFEQGTA